MDDRHRRAAREAARSHLVALGTTVRRLRRAADLTQDDLAERAALDPRVIRYIERAQRDVSVSTLYLLAAALDVQPHDLLPELKSSMSREIRPGKRVF